MHALAPGPGGMYRRQWFAESHGNLETIVMHARTAVKCILWLDQRPPVEVLNCILDLNKIIKWFADIGMLEM